MGGMAAARGGNLTFLIALALRTTTSVSNLVASFRALLA